MFKYILVKVYKSTPPYSNYSTVPDLGQLQGIHTERRSYNVVGEQTTTSSFSWSGCLKSSDALFARFAIESVRWIQGTGVKRERERERKGKDTSK